MTGWNFMYYTSVESLQAWKDQTVKMFLRYVHLKRYIGKSFMKYNDQAFGGLKGHLQRHQMLQVPKLWAHQYLVGLLHPETLALYQLQRSQPVHFKWRY